MDSAGAALGPGNRAEVSDGAKMAMKRGMEQIFQPDWKKVFEPESVMQQDQAITEG